MLAGELASHDGPRSLRITRRRHLYPSAICGSPVSALSDAEYLGGSRQPWILATHDSFDYVPNGTGGMQPRATRHRRERKRRSTRFRVQV
jgi:hypothetical protein